MTEIDVAELEVAVGGEVLKAGQPGYDDARHIFNTRFDRRPAAVVRCRDAADVQAAVDFARRKQIGLSVKGGGHAYAGHTVGDGGLLIDFSSMRRVTIDRDARRARVEPGARMGDLDRASQELGLATPGGTVSTVGVAGLTLGGGSGYLSRQFGLTIDNLEGADVVTADGRLVRASAAENPDLFWALRGGGGNFGIVTAFDFQLHAVGPEVLAGQIVHRFEDATDVLRLYRDFMATADDQITCYAFVLHVPPIAEFPEEFHGALAIDLVVFDSRADNEAAFRPLLDFGDPILAFAAPQPYATVQQSFDSLPAARWESRSHDIAELSDAAIEAFTTHVDDLPGDYSLVYFGPGGGAIARVDPTATAYAGRGADYYVHIMAGWEDAAEDGRVGRWARQLHDAMQPFSCGTAYVNLLGTEEEGRVGVAYGDNHLRLREIKKKWDPQNLLRWNHNIEP